MRFPCGVGTHIGSACGTRGVTRRASPARARRGFLGGGGLGRGQQLLQDVALDAAEGPARPLAVEDGDLQRPVAVAGRAAGVERGHGHPQRVGQRGVVLVGVLERPGDGVGLPTHHDVPGLVDDGAVVGQTVELVAAVGRADLGQAHLDLERLDLLGEDRAEQAGEGVGQRTGVHVPPVVLVAAQVGVPDAGHPQALELAVPADGGEADAVVDLGHLAQRRRGVLGDEEHAVGVREHDNAAAPGDPLAGELRAVPHHLLGGCVQRQRHGAAPVVRGNVISCGCVPRRPPRTPRRWSRRAPARRRWRRRR